jgi:hypothetical protein
MEYKAKLTETLHRIQIYDDNLVKSWALQYCNAEPSWAKNGLQD